MNKSFFKYLEFEKSYSAHTIRAYKDDLSQFSRYVANHFDLNDINEASHIHIRSWMVSLMQNDYSTRSINRKVSVIKTYFKYLKKKQLIHKNPMTKIVTPKTSKRLPEFVREKHIENLNIYMSSDRSFVGIRNTLILSLLYQMGIRRSELISLKESDIDIQRQTIKVLGKGNKERLVPVSAKLLSKIREYQVLKEETFESISDHLLVTDSGKKLYPKFVYNLCKKHLSQVSPNQYLGPHVLRHSFATHLANNGADLNAIKELMGHSSLAATQVYMHNTIDKLKEVYQKSHPKAKSK